MRALSGRRGGKPLTRRVAVSPTHDSVDAWEALRLVVEWIKHAETKAAVTLGTTGVLGGALYSLVASQRRPSVAFGLAAAACACWLLVAAFSASMALRPRLQRRQVPSNLVYFEHVARRFPVDPDVYVEAFSALLSDPPRLVTTIATQIWANSHVARQKYRWSSVGLFSLLAGALAIAAAATIVAL